VNNSGQIVGASDTAGIGHAFSYTHSGGMIDLGTLPGGGYSYATAVNDLGQIVGSSGTASGNEHAVLWRRSPRR
jgi:probable HAF family extracellular repeat protein